MNDTRKDNLLILRSALTVSIKDALDDNDLKSARALIDLSERFQSYYNSDSNDFSISLALTDSEKNTALRGEKITAIKDYRTRTQTGLKEAKDAVEAYLHSQGRLG
jgi:hypothetical protein